MKHILVIPGDGIGPEVILPTVDILSSMASSLEFEIRNAGKGEFQKSGEAISDDLIERAGASDAILFGATSYVRDEGYRSPILCLRKELGLFANIRIARSILPSRTRVDIVIIRENTEGLYTEKEEKDEMGVTTLRRVSMSACERIVKFSFDWCKKHKRKKLLCVHKANVLRHSDGLFLDIFNVEAQKNPEISVSDALIDSASMKLVMAPEEFDTIVTLNLYGDILSDIAAGIIGGLGFMPSANIGQKNALFEPAHGSAPDIEGKGVANPVATLLAATMMLDYLGYEKESRDLKYAIESVARDSSSIFDRNGRCNTNLVFENIIRRLSE